MLLHGRDMYRIFAYCEQPAVYARMQSLYAPVHHFRKTRYVGNIAHVETRVPQSLCSSARADDLDFEIAERLGEVNYSGLVGNTN